VVRALAARLTTAEHADAVARLALDHADAQAALHSAFADGDGIGALELAVALAPYWDMRSALSEARESLERARAVASGAPAVLLATAENWGAYFAALQGDLVQAERLAESALATWRALGVAAGEGYAVLVLGHVALERGDDTMAVEQWQYSYERLRAAGDTWGSTRPLNNMAEAARVRGDLDRARALHEDALMLCRDAGVTFGVTTILCGLGHVLLRQGEPREASRRATEALHEAVAAGSAFELAGVLDLLGLIAAREGRHDEAAQLWGAGDARRRAIAAPVEARDRDDLERAIAGSRAAIGDTFDVEYRRGAEMDVATIVAHVR
jgi:non-specific serine/threonine protein kinase